MASSPHGRSSWANPPPPSFCATASGASLTVTCSPFAKKIRVGMGPILTPGDGGKNRHFIPVLDRGLEPVQEADVLSLHIHVDEPTQIAVLGDPLLEAVEAVIQTVEHLADRGRLVDDRLGLAAGHSPKLRRNFHGHTHRAGI